MAVSDEQIAFVQDLFADLGPVTTRRMFGGLGIYLDATIFALLMSDGRLLLKGAADVPAAFEAAGWQRWRYERDGGQSAAMPYWYVPDDLLDDPDAVCGWARRALKTI
jgi:DNA transformation protein